MSLRLTIKDLKLIKFIGKYKVIKAIDCKIIYKSKDYNLKRLKALEKARYIYRHKRFYIKLDIEGRKLWDLLGYKSYNLCRNKDYQERLNAVRKIALLGLDSKIEFTPSWELKEEDRYTDFGRKYIGKLKYLNREHIVYYISKENSPIYAKQVSTDIKQMYYYKNAIIFLEDFKMLNKRNMYFFSGKESTQIIKPTEGNLEIMRLLEDADIYDILCEVYPHKEILLSNWNKSDYMTEDRIYIIWMPFIDIEKLRALNTYYNSNDNKNKKIDILTLGENKRKIDEILKSETNVIDIRGLIERAGIERILME